MLTGTHALSKDELHVCVHRVMLGINTQCDMCVCFKVCVFMDEHVRVHACVYRGPGEPDFRTHVCPMSEVPMSEVCVRFQHLDKTKHAHAEQLSHRTESQLEALVPSMFPLLTVQHRHQTRL